MELHVTNHYFLFLKLQNVNYDSIVLNHTLVRTLNFEQSLSAIADYHEEKFLPSQVTTCRICSSCGTFLMNTQLHYFMDVLS